jgi:hypothetical protein
MSRITRDRRALAMKLLIAVAFMAGVFATSTGTAHADPVFTINSESELPYDVEEDEELFLVEGAGYTPGNWVVVAVCNRTAGGHFGTHCDASSVSVEQEVDGNGEFSAHIEADGTFVNFNLQSQSPTVPASSTTCFGLTGGNGQCAVQVVEYTDWEPLGPPVSVALCDINF